LKMYSDVSQIAEQKALFQNMKLFPLPAGILPSILSIKPH